MKDILPGEWWPNIDKCIGNEIPCFPTKRAALVAAKAFGWKSNVLPIKRRFERIWIVGKIDFQPDDEGGIEFRVLRAPLLKWIKRADGIQECPVVKFRQPY